ncbi:thiol reductant ABC exporter subunit CydD [Moraxella oblonga]|uniref:thiol reductant ABC exporter subunit CydD n=1 Tax=Moraxella oblonga TaxID=200413 RepID=UPI000AE9145D|nr:thiol reductant ABC exporter subunit CydD [Moraxella oblonga]
MTNKADPKPKKARHARSQEDIMANAFLKNTFKPVKKSMMMAWFLDVVNVLVLMGQAFVIAWLFGVWLDFFVKQDSLLPQPSDDELTMYLGVVFICLCVRAGLSYGRDYLLSEAGLMVATSVKKALLDKLGQLGLARRYFGSDGSLASKMVDEPVHLVGYARFEVQKMTAITTPIILAGCVSFYSLSAGLILLLTAPLVPIGMAFIGVATARKSREQMDALAQLGGRFLDWIRGMNTLSRLGAVDVAVSDIDKSSESYRQKTMSVLKIAFLNSAVLEFLSALSIALVAIYLGFGLLGWTIFGQGTLSYQTALFILLLVPEFYAPLRRLGAEYHVKGQAVACAKAIAPILNFKHKKHTGQAHTLSHAPSFSLKNLTAFGDDGRVRLSPLTAEFGAGQKTAVMGESGAGKSTLLQILLGFGDYEGEVVLTDGDKKVPYQEVNLVQLRQQFGYLSQSLALLPMSIADNLRLAKPHASDDELKQVLQWVKMWDVVNALPQGMHTILGERGRGLSGGQGQRLAIAQLLLQDAKVWLLDEPTEHLDAKTAWQIKELLWQLGAGKTVIWVTHDEDFGEFRFDNIHRLGQKGQGGRL